MSSPTDPPAPRASGRSPEVEHYIAYRRLLIRGYVLYARVTALQCLLAVVSPIATPLIIRAIRRWFEQVAADVNALNKSVRSLRLRVAAERNAPRPAAAATAVTTVFQNPWT